MFLIVTSLFLCVKLCYRYHETLCSLWFINSLNLTEYEVKSEFSRGLLNREHPDLDIWYWNTHRELPLCCRYIFWVFSLKHKHIQDSLVHWSPRQGKLPQDGAVFKMCDGKPVSQVCHLPTISCGWQDVGPMPLNYPQTSTIPKCDVCLTWRLPKRLSWG